MDIPLARGRMGTVVCRVIDSSGAYAGANGPGVSVGGGIFRMPIKTLITGTQLYVMTALDLCNQERGS